MAKRKPKIKDEAPEAVESSESAQASEEVSEESAQEQKSMKELCPNCLKLECECAKEECKAEAPKEVSELSVPGKYRKFQKGN
jgi:hypothetical protein